MVVLHCCCASLLFQPARRVLVLGNSRFDAVSSLQYTDYRLAGGGVVEYNLFISKCPNLHNPNVQMSHKMLGGNIMITILWVDVV